MRIIFIIICLLLVGCANVSTSKFSYITPDGSVLRLEMPKEVDAKNLKVVFNAKEGTTQITSDSWISRNTETIAAQAEREKALLESSSVLAEKVTKAAIEGAMKGAVP